MRRSLAQNVLTADHMLEHAGHDRVLEHLLEHLALVDQHQNPLILAARRVDVIVAQVLAEPALGLRLRLQPFA